MAQINLKMKKLTQTVSVPGHAEQLLKRLQKHLWESKLSDVTLVAGVDDIRVPAHRVVLSSVSEYFRAMFFTPLKESVENDVQLQSVKGVILKQLINYCYSGSIFVTEANVQELLEAAVEYQFIDVVRLCCEYLDKQLDIENCVGFFMFAEHFNLYGLCDQALDAICKNFTKVVDGDEFKELPIDKLKLILLMDTLNVNSEEEIFYAVKKWISFEESRKENLLDLLKCVRFTQLDLSVLQRVNVDMKGADCGDIIDLAMKWSHKGHHEDKEIAKEASLRLMVIGGEMEGHNVFSSIEYYCPRFQKWKYWRNFPDARTNYAVVVAKNNLYIIGGELNGECLSSVCRLDIISMVITSLPDMKEKRKNHSVCVVDDSIYVVGGENENGMLASVERYSLEVDTTSNDAAEEVETISMSTKTYKWANMLSLRSPRSCAAIAVCADRIYLFGGHPEGLSNVETYDIISNKWHDGSSMNSWRFNIGTAELNGYIYAAGGFYGSENMDIVERYDPVKDSWTSLSSFPGKACSRLHTLNGELYALGLPRDIQNQQTANYVYKYNEKMDTWMKMEAMNANRLIPGVFTIDFGQHLHTDLL